MDEVEMHTQWDTQRRKVDIDQSDVSTRELIRMVVDGEMKIAPDYQRKFRWQPEAQSKLIESILLGLPVPNIFVATNLDGSWEVVDGLQRISTLIHFAAEDEKNLRVINATSHLKLVGLEKLSNLNEVTFSGLPKPLQLAFYKRSLRIVAISDKSDVDVRFDMFERLNTGGVVLSAQEIRACIYRGPFNDFLRESADNPLFTQLLKLQRLRQHDGSKEELVLKTFAYLDNRSSFDGRVKVFLNEYMKAQASRFDISEGRRLLNTACAQLNAIVNGPILRGGYKLTPLNQFEAILVAACEIVRAGSALQQPRSADWLNDKMLVASSSKGTNTKPSLTRRIDRARELLSGRA